MIQEFRQLSAVVGRRTALKYAGLGLIAATLSACGGDGSDSDGSPKKAMLTAFAKGKWKVGAEGGTGVLAVEDGKWTLEGNSPPGQDSGLLNDSLYGTYQFDAGVLTVSVQRDESDEPNIGTATSVPNEVSDKENFSASWSYDQDGFTVPVTWDGKKMVVQVTHQQYGGLIVFTAERM
ncbi:hypothetical protein [Cryptosporangium minutisporangium]|uniref:Lipocalin-like domain-containing protein n=1 Tax=Cryptosporangium minutisporangium TaxID=113569 RepID=A0ABP6T007_9ACTN